MIKNRIEKLEQFQSNGIVVIFMNEGESKEGAKHRYVSNNHCNENDKAIFIGWKDSQL